MNRQVATMLVGGTVLWTLTAIGLVDLSAIVEPVSAASTSAGTASSESVGPPTAFTMDRFLSHWWIFPTAILFSGIALAAGVSGALFFSPFFMFVVGLTPAQAIGAGLLTEVFGMGNGLRAYVKQEVVDYRTAKWLLAGAVPAVVAGAVLAHYSGSKAKAHPFQAVSYP